MGPMCASYRFVQGLSESGILPRVARVQADLYGSLALTGLGHATDHAVLLGLAGNEPATIDPESIAATIARVRETKQLTLGGERAISFEESGDLLFHRSTMFPPGARMQHPNGLRLTAYDVSDIQLEERTF